MPGVCPVSGPRRTHARVRRRREPDAKTLDATITTLELLAGPCAAFRSGAPGLLPAAHALTCGTGCRRCKSSGVGNRASDKALPHNSLTK